MDSNRPNPITEKANELSMADAYPQPDNQSTVPIETSYSSVFHDTFNGETKTPIVNPSPPKATGYETFKHALADNDIALLWQSEQQHYSDNPLSDPKPDGWSPHDDEAQFAGIEQRYWGPLNEATGPKDLMRKHYDALDAQEKDRYYEDGSMIAKLGGAGAALTLSPSSWITVGLELKSARVSQRILNTIGSVPSIALGSATHEALEESAKTAGNLQDWALDTFRDTIFGTAFMGTLEGLGFGYTASKMWNARKIVDLHGKDIDLIPVISEDGSITRVIASSKSASAAEVGYAQQFADSSMAKKGLFGVPIIGGWLGKGAGKINPIIRGLNSRFPSVRAYFDRGADHGIVTEGNIAGKASPDKFEVKFSNLQDSNTRFMYLLKGLHLERNGIDSANRIKGGLSEIKMRWGKEGYTSPEKFMDEIENVLITENPHTNGAVNEAASMIRTRLDESYKAFREAYDLPEEWLPPKTAKGYLNRVYDIEHMKLNEDKWMQTVTSYLKSADAEINSRMQPIRESEARHKEAEKLHLDFIKKGGRTDAEIKASADTYLAAKKATMILKEKLQDDLRSNNDLRIHVEDVTRLSATEGKKLKKILKPLNQAKRSLKQKKESVASLKFEILKAKERAVKGKTANVIEKPIENLDALEKQLPAMEAEVLKRESAVNAENLKLQEAVQEGKISKIYYDTIPNSPEVKFKKPSDRLKMRPEYESDYHIAADAKAYYDTIMNQTAEDTISQVMGTLLGKAGENPLKKRSIMLPDVLMYENGFLSKNLGVNVANYVNVLGRKTILKNVYKDVSLEGGIAPLVSQTNAEFKAMKAELDSKIKNLTSIANRTKKQESELTNLNKEVLKLQKEFDLNISDMNHAYNKMMGRNRGSDAQRKWSSIARNFAVTTKLGAVPLTMVVDMMAIPMKHGLWPSIRDGLLPALKNMKNLVAQGKGAKYERNAPHMNMGLNHVLSAYSDRNWAGSSQPYAPLSGSLVKGTETMAHLSQNIAGTNQIENFYQEVTSAVFDSKIIRYLKDFKEGKLDPKDKEKLLVSGIQPEIWADRMLNEWKAAGSDGNGFGGYRSKFWEWSDKEAANKMSETLRRGVKDTIIRRGMFDAPFALDDPIIGTMFLFKGWVMASMTRYLTPVMQRPDAEKLIGTMLMLSAGSMVTPMRRLAKGEDPIQDGDNMFWNAMVDGGVFSVITDTLEQVNVLMGGALLKDVKNDRYGQRTIAGFLAGPLGSMGDDMAHIMRMMATGNYNQTDVNKAARLIPFTQSWQFRGFSNKIVESSGLPKTYGEASKQ